MNRATLLGNVGKDPEFRKTIDGLEICMFSFATHERTRNKTTKENNNITHWHSIVIKNIALVDLAKKYVGKGSKLLLEGKIVARQWKDDYNKDHYKTEIILEGFDAKLILLGEKQEDKNSTY